MQNMSAVQLWCQTASVCIGFASVWHVVEKIAARKKKRNAVTKSFSAEMKLCLQTDHYARPMQNRCRPRQFGATVAQLSHNKDVKKT